MSLQKEDDDFNAWFNKQTINAVPDADLSLQRLWALLAWQAQEAKAQEVAVPEGFVLMPRICTNKMAHAAKAIDGRLSAFKYADVYKAMIEAQENST